jgi:hypothetical protein
MRPGRRHRPVPLSQLPATTSAPGFGYYWPIVHPSRRPDPAVLRRYEANFPDQPHISPSRRIGPAFADVNAINAALTQAITQARAHPGAQIWLFRSQVNPTEHTAWKPALQTHGLTAVPTPTAGNSLSVVHLTDASHRERNTCVSARGRGVRPPGESGDSLRSEDQEYRTSGQVPAGVRLAQHDRLLSRVLG